MIFVPAFILWVGSPFEKGLPVFLVFYAQIFTTCQEKAFVMLNVILIKQPLGNSYFVKANLSTNNLVGEQPSYGNALQDT